MTILPGKMHTSELKGYLVATVLSGSWRAFPPPFETCAAELSPIVRLLLKSGVGGLAWWRIRQSTGLDLPFALRRLRVSYLSYAVQAAEHENEIVAVFKLLRSFRIEPILLKGWALARAYAESGLRPCGDIDVYVSPACYAKAKAVLSCGGPFLCDVDLRHDAITRFSEFTFEELYTRSQLVDLSRAEIRVFGAEDHLRIVCLHMLKHGAWRPLWLCDVAAALESRPQNFDWERCLGRDKKRANWILSALALAGQLLGADVRDTPAQGRIRALPKWLVKSVLKQWGTAYPRNLPMFIDQLRQGWWSAKTLQAIRQRWPNPIQATVDADGSFDYAPTSLYQLRDVILRTTRLCCQVPGLFRN
jgi:putative nucleotidyltransferase-like protein